MGEKPAEVSESPGLTAISEAPAISESSVPEQKSIDQIESLTIEDVIRMEEPNTQSLYDNSRYDFPITVNSKVEGWIDYFTGRGRPHMERYLSRSSRYIPAMKKILKEEGIPEDLIYLALIESGFNLRARSRARAVGPWQFIAGTGKRYGLKINFWIDERKDFERSTRAAAKYLKDLYLMFESWYLAAAAYNAGEYRILSAIQRLGTNNYWRLCETTILRRETRDYVPKLIAAAIIAKNQKKFGFDDLDFQAPLEYSTVTVDYSVHLKDVANLLNAEPDEILDLNPELVRGMVPPEIDNYPLRVPVGSHTLVRRALAAQQSQLNKPVMPVNYTVRRGDNLSDIARKFGVSLHELKQINHIQGNLIYPGKELMIPVEVTPAKRAQTVKAAPKIVRTTASGDSGDFVFYVVKSGDSLWSIAEKYNVTVQNIFQWNTLKGSKIFPGKRLKIKSRDATSRTAEFHFKYSHWNATAPMHEKHLT